MKRYYINDADLMHCSYPLDLTTLLKPPYRMWRDERYQRTYVETESKPNNAPIAGIFWKPDKE